MDTDAPERRPPDVRQQAYEDVGARLRAYRERAGIGVRELARRVGVSPSMISQIETDKTQPSVSTLYAIVSVLAVSLDELFAPDDALASRDDGHGSRNDGHERVVAGEGTQLVVPPSVAELGSPVQRASSRKAIQLAGGVRWDRLTAQHDREVDFLFVVYEPGADSSEAHTYMRHSGKEYGIVLKGQLAVAVGFEKYVLGPGDSISFDSTSPHRLWNSGEEPVHAIWVVIGRYAGPPQQDAR